MDKVQYIDYLTKEKKLSENTCLAYIRDLTHFESFLYVRGINDLKEASNSDVMAYVMNLKEEEMTRATVNRKLASIRTYYKFIFKNGDISIDPTIEIKSPRIEKKDIEFLSIEEIDSLMSIPKDNDKGKRDLAILELLYATGIRASELITLKLDDVNLRMGFIKCSGPHSKARIIPIGRICRKAVEDYIFDVRDKILKEDSPYLFVNYVGEPMTRQGLWKILKEYGSLANLKLPLTPQIIRNSFAVHMLQNGADVKSVQELMGHEDISATQAYLSVTKSRIKDVYDKAHPRA